MTPQDKVRAKLAAVYMSIEHDARRECSVEEAAMFAACNRDIVETFLREQATADSHSVAQSPLDKLGILSNEFSATASVLTALGYQCTASDHKTGVGEFTRPASAKFRVKQDGSWSSPDLKGEVSNGVDSTTLSVLMGTK